MFRIGIDIGGTFTDFAVWRAESDGYEAIASYKLPSSRPNYAQAVIEGLGRLIDRYGIGKDDPVLVVHGTTVGTNAVIERSEPPVALITTEGFRDILGLGRLRLDKPISLFNRRTVPLTPRELVFCVDERLRADGSVDRPLDEAALIGAARRAQTAGAAALGICFLHAHRNPVHERRALALLAQHVPGLPAMASHEVWAQQSEYERAVLTLLNVYVKRLMATYIAEIESFLSVRLPNARLFISKSNGGIMSAEEARRLPVHTLLSGPSAGVTGAQTLGGFLGVGDILTMDMGGTSTDLSLVQVGRSTITGKAEVGDFPLFLPVTAIEAMGAGGGSVAWLDGAVLKVGPKSAGSRPGPACYGQGGTAPTLTDAYLLCGYLSPAGLLGGRLPLSADLAAEAIGSVAGALGGDVTAAAEACIDVATSSMLAKVLPFLARLGVEPTELTLMIFGGAGGIHGPLLADEIGIRRVLVPRLPSVFCAFGCLVSDLVHDTVRTVTGAALSGADLHRILNELADTGRAWLDGQVLADQVQGVESLSFAEMRYEAQSFTVAVDVSAELANAAPLEAFHEAFHREHERLFGHANRNAPVAVNELRVRTIGRQPKPATNPAAAVAGQNPAPASRRQLRFAGAWAEDCPVFDRQTLAPGWQQDGPAMIEQDVATLLVPPGFTASVGALGDLWLVKEQ